ncbi:hypothetical protein LNA01_21940 [Companilactobacillus nantensis]|nr:hypothetical protein LNA01_21940 [Companilactobacillus nantensis]
MIKLVLLASPTAGVISAIITNILIIIACLLIYLISEKTIMRIKKSNSRLELIKYKIENKNRRSR